MIHSKLNIIQLRIILICGLMFLSRWTAHEQRNITFILLKTRWEEGHQFVNSLPDRHAQFVIIQWITCVVPKLANLLMHSQCALCSNIAKSENAMLCRMFSRLETCIVYSCIWSVTLAKSIVPRKTWRKLWNSYIYRSVFVNSPPPKPEVILTNFFAEPTVLLVPITSGGKVPWKKDR
jgi:hypothetical protein